MLTTWLPIITVLCNFVCSQEQLYKPEVALVGKKCVVSDLRVRVECVSASSESCRSSTHIEHLEGSLAV